MNAMAALADETRREIVLLVARRGELSSSEIGRNFPVSAPAISQHLKVLREAGLLQVKRDAQWRIYGIDESGLHEVESWVSEVRSLWNKRLDRLGRYLTELKKERTRARERR